VTESCIEIRQLSKSFTKEGRPALNQIQASLKQGEIICLAGPDGAGKTTLIRLIAGLLKPTQGAISVFGYDSILQASEIHRLMGYMPQKFGLYEDLTVIQNLNFFADLTGIIREQRKEIFQHLLELFELSPFVDRLAGALSGGMKQKLGLACTLTHKPQLLLLDEPSVGVDPLSRRELWNIIYQLQTQGVSVILSTAYLDEVARCQTVMLLNQGELLFFGKPDELTERVKGRTFLMTDITGSRRKLLMDSLLQPEIIDGVIQGENIRIVSQDYTMPPFDSSHLKDAVGVKWVSTPPRFEDAFIDILGGSPKGESLLAKTTPLVKSGRHEVIQAIKLTKRFGNFTAANEIDFTVYKGEVFGLLGPNGAGKSTTFKMLCGLLRPTSGRALVEGLDLQTASSLARTHMGYMAQKFSLYNNLTVHQNLFFFSGIYNLTGLARYKAIEEMIEIFSLKSYLNESTESLPLGFKQRLALACALMHHPAILFLDEPTSGVDPVTRREFWGHINGLVEKGVTIMVTTHFMEEAEYCDRLALIYHSQVIRLGSSDELKAEARSETNPDPTLEEAFIHLIQKYESNKQ